MSLISNFLLYRVTTHAHNGDTRFLIVLTVSLPVLVLCLSEVSKKLSRNKETSMETSIRKTTNLGRLDVCDYCKLVYSLNTMKFFIINVWHVRNPGNQISYVYPMCELLARNLHFQCYLDHKLLGVKIGSPGLKVPFLTLQTI